MNVYSSKKMREIDYIFQKKITHYFLLIFFFCLKNKNLRHSVAGRPPIAGGGRTTPKRLMVEP